MSTTVGDGPTVTASSRDHRSGALLRAFDVVEPGRRSCGRPACAVHDARRPPVKHDPVSVGKLGRQVRRRLGLKRRAAASWFPAETPKQRPQTSGRIGLTNSAKTLRSAASRCDIRAVNETEMTRHDDSPPEGDQLVSQALLRLIARAAMAVILSKSSQGADLNVRFPP